MQIFVHAQGAPVSVDVNGVDTIETLKRQLQTRTSISSSDMELVYDGRILEDLCTVEDYSLCAEANLNLILPVKGGKVHGSLARAGKVRGQTPKVEKADKKKKLVGRAKRRIQYNRRFVNMVVGFGKKKGPNSNTK
eukprot:CAMPEP_0114541570 /NCGR_PEP_ID=MMETSP0114-20121206/1375_1 /TAXON_ID=31324 /ORGANISM="Goniomonas sp, Strain m" /LENGTH=135 /DNA_ID=CAMNT_0001725815 /DNA_START=26 /DNA_END=433 /DNA_ORIENTATION=+